MSAKCETPFQNVLPPPPFLMPKALTFEFFKDLLSQLVILTLGQLVTVIQSQLATEPVSYQGSQSL